MRRSEAREAAFLLIFEKSFTEENTEEVLEAAAEARDVKLSGFARTLFEGTIANKEECDGLIDVHSKNWGRERITRVSLAVMRMAVYEMLHGEGTPEAVVINEAVELAKKYAGEEEAAFVNGVLGGISRRNA